MIPSPPKLNFWPFKPKEAPPLHRALQRENGDQHDDDEENGDHRISPQNDEAAFLTLQQLATKRRVRKKDSLQRNALHIACANQPDLDTVALLIDVYPKAIDQPDKLGRLPLHTACANRASMEVVEYLWRQNPDTVFEVTDRGVSSTTIIRCELQCRI
jgi:ankyrin repeat protein